MIYYLVSGIKVDPNGVPLTDEQLATLAETVAYASDVVPPGEPASPFADLAPAAQKALADAGITTAEQAKALGAEGLEKLDGIGPKTAEQILAL